MLGVLCPSLAPAQTFDADDIGGIEIHGFVSQGFLLTTDNEYLAKSERGSFELSEVGINFTKQLSDDLRVGMQLFARDVGPLGDYRPHFDWYYLDYRVADWLGVRVGRTKLPFGLYNETSDVDQARVPVLLPQSVYPIQYREVLLAQTGAELHGLVPIGALGELEYRVYGGTIYLDTSNAGPELREFDVPYMVGARLHWLTPLEGLTLGGSAQRVRLEAEVVPPPEQLDAYRANGQVPPGYPGSVAVQLPITLWITSAEYQLGELSLAAEYTRARWEFSTSLWGLDQTSVNEGLYAMVAYRVRRWFTPGLYYSRLRADLTRPHGPSGYQHDVALTLRYDLTDNWLLKLEGHYLHGTAALDSTLNGGRPLDALEEDWGLFIAKTTAYF